MIELGGKSYGPGNPMIVAEISSSHCGSLEKAVQLVRTAHICGADAVKFQAFRPEHLTVASEAPHFMLEGKWGGSLWNLYSHAQTPFDWIPKLAGLAEELGLGWFCSVFNPEGVALLEEMGCPAYKIASPEAEWDDLLFAVAATTKPMIVSDGMLTPQAAARIRFLTGDAVILRCVSSYPAKAEEYGFHDIARAPTRVMLTTGDFMHPHRGPPQVHDEAPTWGLSDHSCSLTTAVVAASMGASMIEAHLMLSIYAYTEDGLPLDFGHSLNPTLFRAYAAEAKKAAKMAYGTRADDSDAPWRRSPWRRRLVWAKDMKKGDTVTATSLLCVRSAEGPLAKHAHLCIGATTKVAEKKWDPINVGALNL